MTFKHGEKLRAKFWPARNKSRQERIPVIASQRTIFERAQKAASAYHQRCASCYVPLVFRDKRKCDVCQARGHSGQFVRNRTHILDFKPGACEGFPFAPFDFASTCKHQSTLERFSLTGLGRLSIQGYSRVERSHDQL